MEDEMNRKVKYMKEKTVYISVKKSEKGSDLGK
jgi:hypothetical protein